jgi:endonuclease/exonuclease/phosphatase family metal-dependent hydrolase
LDDDFESFTRCDSSIAANGTYIRKGGVAIMWRRSLAHAITPMYKSGNNRIQVLKIESLSMRPVYIINVYLPSANYSYEEFKNHFNELMDVYQPYSQMGEVLIVGDFNVSLNMGPQRSGDHRRAHYVQQFLYATQQTSAVTLDMCQGPDVTYLPYSGAPGTQIDHIMVNNASLDNIDHVYVCDDNAGNTSDHLPVCIGWRYLCPRIQLESRQLYRWDKADTNLYRYTLDTLVVENNLCDRSVVTPIEIDSFCDRLTALMRQASDNVVPKSRYCPHRRPYWTDSLKGLHAKKSQLRIVWIQEGRPRGRQYPSYVNYKTAKQNFAKTLVKTAYDFEQKKYHHLSSSHDTDIRRFWKYIKSCKGSSNSLHTIRDEDNVYQTPDQLLVMWRSHFNNLLNEQSSESIKYDNDFKRHIDDYVQNIVDGDGCRSTNTEHINLSPYSLDEISIVCDKLPVGKAPGIDCIYYEHVKYSGIHFRTCVVKLFNAILESTFIPNAFKVGLLIPLYKGHRKPKDNRDSYRGVTLLPAMNKILEKCILVRLEPFLERQHVPHPLQHACRKGVSSTMVSFLAQEAIFSHTEKGGNVYACYMDVKRAFDSIYWNGFFYKLHQIGIRNKLWFIFYAWFRGSNCRVLVNGQLSDPFEITRSIKQGGVMSMLNFCLSLYDIHDYIDPDRQLGLHCNGIYVGTPAFADDILLLANTKNSLDKMIANATDYARKWRFTFSDQKSKCMVFGESKRQHTQNKDKRLFKMHNAKLEEVSHYSHVGITLCAYNSHKYRTDEMCLKGNCSFSGLIGAGVRSNGLYPDVSLSVWRTMCLPAMLYGSEVWYNLTKTEIYQLEKVQCRCLRKILGFPMRTHNALTRSVLSQTSIHGLIKERKLMFLHKLVSLDNALVVKKLFLSRLYEHIIFQNKDGFVPDIFQITREYGLNAFLINYGLGQIIDIPRKAAWKSTVKNAIKSLEYTRNLDNLSEKKDSSRFIRTMHSTENKLLLWQVMKHCKYKGNIRPLLTIIRLMTLPEMVDLPILCKLCNMPVMDICTHVIMTCSTLFNERNILCDELVNMLPVEASVELFNLEDESITDIIMGHRWNRLNGDNINHFYMTIAPIIVKHFINAFYANLNWFRDVL